MTAVCSAQSSDAAELAAVAAVTFPLACPPSAAPDDIASFIAETLSADRFAEYLADPRRVIIKASDHGRIVGYTMLIRDDDRAELSKMYVQPAHHGTGVSTTLMHAAVTLAVAWGAESIWLGVNQTNERAQRFYLKSGFTVTGTRTFQLGSHTEHDYVMTRPMP